MRFRLRPYAFVLALSLYLVVAFACAHGLTVKQKASQTHQSVHQALITLDDFERTICQPAAPPNSNTCTRKPAIITEAQHQAFSRLLVSAYDADIKIARAIIAWEPCQRGADGKILDPCVPTPVPTDIGSLKTYMDQAVQIITALTTPSAEVQRFLDLARAVLTSVAEVEAAFKRGTVEATWIQ